MEALRTLVLLALSAGMCFGQDTPEELVGAAALGIRVLGQSSGTQNDDNESTSSYTITSPSLLVAYVVNSKASSPNTPTASGNGLTWNELFTTNFLSTHRLTVFTAKNLFGGSAGAFTATTSGVNQTGWAIGVFEVTDPAMRGGTGTNSIRQRPNVSISSSTSGTINFGTLGSRTLCIAGFSGDVNSSYTPEDGWTSIIAQNYANPTTFMGVEYQLRGTDSTGSCTNSSFSGMGYGLEFYQQGARD